MHTDRLSLRFGGVLANQPVANSTSSSFTAPAQAGVGLPPTPERPPSYVSAPAPNSRATGPLGANAGAGVYAQGEAQLCLPGVLCNAMQLWLTGWTTGTMSKIQASTVWDYWCTWGCRVVLIASN
jgi:hypothetical protein